MVSTQQRKRIIMGLLLILGIWGLSITRELSGMVLGYSIFGIVDIGTIIGITSFIALYWKWRGLE